jgi:hypothetical protein
MLMVDRIAAGMSVLVPAHGHQQAANRHHNDEYTYELANRFHLGKAF